jgi:Cu/Ag efflux protein CusF
LHGRPLLVILIASISMSCHTQTTTEKLPAPTPTPAIAQKNPLEYPSPTIGRPYPGTGIVRTINLAEGWVEIEHEEVKDLMPAMTMEFWVKDKSLLRKVRTGDKVDFEIVETGKGQYVTSLKKVAP